MNNIHSIALVMMTGMALSAGCSVKEARSLCPCTLVLDFSEVDTTVVRSADLFVSDEESLIIDEMLASDELLQEEYIVEIPRKDISLGVWSGTDHMYSGTGLEIPYGEDCPPVYFHVSQIDADVESVREVVRLHKNHCVMTVKIDWKSDNIGRIVLYGNVDGYESDGSPSSGDFEYDLHQSDDGNCMAILPRQTDDSLILEVNDGTGVLKRFPLGEYIVRSGYDWSEPDLKDVVVELDVAILQVALTIQGWDTTHRFDVVI